MAELEILMAELALTTPINYTIMTDQQATASLNDPVVDQNRSSLTGDEMFTATDSTEWTGLTDQKRDLWVSWCNTERDPFDAANVAFVNFIFGGGSTTVSNLATIRVEQISQGQAIGFGTVRVADVARARLANTGG